MNAPGNANAEPPATLPLRTLALRRGVGFEEAAERLAAVAEGEGYRVVGAHPLSRRADPEKAGPGIPPAVALELETPELLAAVLRARPEAAALFPVRLLLVQREGALRLTTLEPTAYRALFEAPSDELRKRLSWLEVTLDIVLRSLA